MLEDKHDLRYNEILKRMDKGMDKRYDMYCIFCRKYVPFVIDADKESEAKYLVCSSCRLVIATIREKGESE